MAPPRFELITLFRKKWVNGTVLRYYFFDEESDGEFVQGSGGAQEWRSWVGPEAQREVVRRAFQAWMDVGIGVSFQEVASRDEAEIRIGFMRGDGSWSYVGRDLIDLNLSVNERTMNFGWDLTRSPAELDTAIHEIGHTLGFPHEHQNPNAGIVWNEEAVYAALAKPPNRWDRQKTFYNIIRKIAPDTVQGSNWDPDSVMHYRSRLHPGAGRVSQRCEARRRPLGARQDVGADVLPVAGAGISAAAAVQPGLSQHPGGRAEELHHPAGGHPAL